jgi:TetR/AcrR family transcriptional repressor of lmrAB and yxaGH operons
MANAAVHKESLVRTAMRLFRRQGYASSGLQQILSESGAPKGSLYHYFPNGKEGLGEAAVTLAGEMIAGMLADLATRHRDPQAFVRGYCRTMAGWMEESEFRSGCPIATTLLETAPTSESIREAGRAAFRSWTTLVSDVFAESGMERREARTLAQLIIAAMEGALILARVQQSTRPILDVAKLVPRS